MCDMKTPEAGSTIYAAVDEGTERESDWITTPPVIGPARFILRYRYRPHPDAPWESREKLIEQGGEMLYVELEMDPHLTAPPAASD
jgi:hypothetical protein